MTLKLGRKAVKHDTRRLMLKKYLPAVVTPPPAVDWTKGVTSFGMMLNDQLGCCTIAGVGHAVQVWSLNAGEETTVPDSTILAYYEDWDGYVDGDPSTDQGGIEENVLDDWRHQGFAGHTLVAYADPTVSNIAEVKTAINLFVGLYIGLNVPQSAMDSSNDNTVVWDVGGNSAIVGGHAVYVVGYDADTVTFVSWGQLYKMTWAFWNQFVDEAHALLGQDVFIKNGLDPQGLNVAQLQADLAQIQ
jgi:hypothetical protein